MKSGYDQFFKNARKASGTDSSPSAQAPRASSARPINKSKFNVNDGKILKQLLPKKKKRSQFSWKLTAISLVGFAIALFGFQNHEKIEDFVKDIEIGFLGTASAESKPASHNKEPKEKAQSKTAPAESDEKSKKESEKAPAEVQDSANLDYLQKLNERKKSLDEREQELARQDEELQKQRAEIEKRVEELKALRGQISTVLDDRVKIDDQKVEVLVQTYSNMKPPQAAKILESMDEDLAVEILGRMKKKNAADVMNLIKPEKAQVISEKFAGYKRKPAAAAPAPSSAKSPGNNENEATNNKN